MDVIFHYYIKVLVYHIRKCLKYLKIYITYHFEDNSESKCGIQIANYVLCFEKIISNISPQTLGSS